MKTILITGSTSGIGFETAKALAKQGNSIFVVGRDKTKVNSTIDSLKTLFPQGNHLGFVANLSSHTQVRNLAQEVKSKCSQLDVLVNNAGAYYTEQQFSEDKIEMTWATNHLTYMLLVHELMDLLKAAPKARIVNVASHSHYNGKMNFDDISLSKKWNGYKAYEQSKLGNVLFTMELAERLKGTNITVNALHPGVVKTDIAIKNGAWYARLFWGLIKNFVAISIEQGAATSIFLASSPEVEGENGKYWDKCKHKWQSKFSQTPGLKEQCWAFSCKQLGLPENWN